MVSSVLPSEGLKMARKPSCAGTMAPDEAGDGADVDVNRAAMALAAYRPSTRTLYWQREGIVVQSKWKDADGMRLKRRRPASLGALEPRGLK